jgi:predicted nucleic acid-binding protein
MLIHLDTSLLIDAFTGERRSMARVRHATMKGDVTTFSTIVLYEWLRGPRHPDELRDQELLFPRETSVAFGAHEAAEAARLYRRVAHARGREVDLAIAACAIVQNASLWTLNREDFVDIPGLTLAD